MERIYQTVKKISETLNTFFSDAVKNLGIPQYEGPTVDTSDISDSLLKAIAKYKNHPCVRRVKNNYMNLTTFSFQYVMRNQILKKNHIRNKK